MIDKEEKVLRVLFLVEFVKNYRNLKIYVIICRNNSKLNKRNFYCQHQVEKRKEKRRGCSFLKNKRNI